MRYDVDAVGKRLQSWGLPWQIVAAGYLLPYENHLIQKKDSDDLLEIQEIQEHKREALNYLHCIEDDDLSTLLHPPYKDLSALLIALAVQAAALDIHARKTRQGQRYQPENYAQLENVGQTLLHITKRLGMWYFKRQDRGSD